jgi:hypothetical protein
MVITLIREGYWNSLEAFCQDYYKKTSDPVYVFWKGFALYNLGNVNGAINDLLSIQQKKEIAYACIVGLLFYQNKAKNTDRVTFKRFRKKLIISEEESEMKEEMDQIRLLLKLSFFLALWESSRRLKIFWRRRTKQHRCMLFQQFGMIFTTVRNKINRN